MKYDVIEANEHIRIGSNSYEKVKTFKYLGSLETNQNSIHDKIKCRHKAGNSCYYSVQTLLSSTLFSKNMSPSCLPNDIIHLSLFVNVTVRIERFFFFKTKLS